MDDILATHHADLRLMQRTGDVDVSMSDVWNASVPCEVKYRTYDEARVSSKYDLVLLYYNGRVEAVLPASGCEITVEDRDLQDYLGGAVDG